MKDFKGRFGRRRSRRASFEDVFGFEELPGTHEFAHGAAKRDHKTAQLCRQVLRALSLALPECADEVVRDLTVVDVTPAADAGRLMVWVAFGHASRLDAARRSQAKPLDVSSGEGLSPVADVLARLESARGFLRREVAGAITRKRAPELSFVLVPPAGAGEVRP